MLIKAERTGNKVFGSKDHTKESTITIAGLKLKLTIADTWSSGEHAGDGEYIRCSFLEEPKVDPWPNIKQPKVQGDTP